MKASAWLLIELRKPKYGTKLAPHIVGVRKHKPTNELAVHVTLDFAEGAFDPHVEAMVSYGLISLDIVDPDPPEELEPSSPSD